jgi:signal transduction histidine kinase
MQFEIELAQQAATMPDVRRSLSNIKTDIAAINELVTATLGYAILERADVALNIGAHNFTTLIPAIADAVKRDARPDILINAHVQSDAENVRCDVHLFETVFKNLLYNATRYARHEIRVTFETHAGMNRLLVDDDGPGVPEQDRQRVFESFVQLDRAAGRKTGFGLGLAIVKRAMEWHGGEVAISQAPLGGARFCAAWPAEPYDGRSSGSG